MARFTSVEATIDDRAKLVLARLPSGGWAGGLVEFVVFGLKQGWACLFGGIFLAVILLSALVWPQNDWLTRYDFLFLSAVAIQLAMLGLKLEQPREVLVIVAFHLIGTGMELFKTAHGSWSYPEAAFFRIEGVPLFSGFMYGAVGSYLARVTRIFELRYSHYPQPLLTGLLAIAIYANFFADYYRWDFRILLYVATAVLYGRCMVYFRVFKAWRKMPMILGFALVAVFIWIGKNLGTWSKVWLYPNQKHGWELVLFSKFGSWFLLMIISFVLVNVMHKPNKMEDSVKHAPALRTAGE